MRRPFAILFVLAFFGLHSFCFAGHPAGVRLVAVSDTSFVRIGIPFHVQVLSYAVPSAGDSIRIALQHDGEDGAVYVKADVTGYTEGREPARPDASRVVGGPNADDCDFRHIWYLNPPVADGSGYVLQGDWYSVRLDTASMACACRFAPNSTGKQRMICLDYYVYGQDDGQTNVEYVYLLRQE